MIGPYLTPDNHLEVPRRACRLGRGSAPGVLARRVTFDVFVDEIRAGHARVHRRFRFEMADEAGMRTGRNMVDLSTG